MRALRLVVVVSSCLLPVAAAAAALGPGKGSQLVTLSSSGPCPIPGHTGINAFALSRRVGVDGVAAPLVIPAKKLLVLSDVSIVTGSEPAGALLAASVIVGSAAGGEIVAARFETAASSGAAAATFAFPTGVAVRSGATACVELLNLTQGGFTGMTGFAHGYLAADK
jgi:hypothetical protein